MITARDFLIRGLLAGLLAGFVAFGVAYVVGEPSINAAIALEEAGTAEAPAGTAADGHTHSHDETDGTASSEGHNHGEEAEVSRTLQSTAGLLTATAVTGTTLGGLVGVLSALAIGRVGRLQVRGVVLFTTGIGFVAISLVPFLGYPPNPPAVGQGGTIGYRTTLFLVLLAISVIAAAVAVVSGVRLRERIGGWYASLAAGAAYLIVVTASIALLPTYDEVPAGFPASLLYAFRGGSLLTQLSLWLVLGVVLAELAHRRVTRGARVEPTRTPDRVAA